MKRTLKIKTLVVLGLVAISTSCKKYLDVNTNPNDVTSATPDLILPQALASTAALSQTYNGATYGGDLGGYMANAGGVSGFGDFWTFVFNSGDATGCWSSTFDNLQDYQYILNNTASTGTLKNFNAIARTMKAFDYLRLVDAYGDVPYTQALQGASFLTPAYDKGSDVYKACITEIDNAITTFKAANTGSTVSVASSSNGTIDVTKYSSVTASSNVALCGSSGLDMTNWIKFANTIKLRALIRIQNVTALSAFYTTEKATMTALTTADFISADVLVNPGYVQQSGKQNPLWNAYAWTYTGTTASKSYIPTTFVTAFYNGTKLTDGKKAAGSNTTPADNGRGNLIYRDYLHSNQLGFQSTNATLQPANPTGGEWYVGTGGNGTPTGLAATGFGIMKGFDMGQPVMTAAESYFLQAEAAMIGLVPGTAATLFNNGVQASFAYLDKDHNDNISSTLYVATNNTPATQLANYQASNPTSYLVNFALATTPAQQLEAIITQKYIALNMLNNDEGWNEYRRTLYPVSIPPSNVASNSSNSFSPAFMTIATPRSDGLAGRILYPATEFSYNTANVPSVDVNKTLVFWDARPTN